MSQEERILSHLLEHGSITPKEAYERYGIMRLGARIYDLKAAGKDIRTSLEVSFNRYGDRVRYARYWLNE